MALVAGLDGKVFSGGQDGTVRIWDGGVAGIPFGKFLWLSMVRFLLCRASEYRLILFQHRHQYREITTTNPRHFLRLHHIHQ